MAAADDFFDVLIVGAGLSGIGAACHLKRRCPRRAVVILESRQSLGGTWDLFRYPGVRSDSDMYTLGYSFRPWPGKEAIADGASILRYLQDTAREEGVDQLIRFSHRVQRASWSSERSEWAVEANRDDGTVLRLRCGFLLLCSGYYDYAQGHEPAFEGRERFLGRVVHPQHWGADVEHAGKRVVVIGSGATAVTLIPALAREAAHVTMLQRSPSYLLSRPSADPLANKLQHLLGPRIGTTIARWKSLLVGALLVRQSRRRPQAVKAYLLGLLRRELPADYDVGTHFTPRYNPWEQRLCLVPDGDLFDAIRAGRASVVTDTIRGFTPGGLALESGAELPADLVVTATGLRMSVLSRIALEVDGRRLDPSQLLNYKGVMFRDVPNLGSVFGYTNASWTLKADLAARFVCRLLNHMERRGMRRCVPASGGAVQQRPWVDLSSGYFQRAIDQLPRQGTSKPWKLNDYYLADWVTLRWGALEDGVLRFSA